MSSGSEALRIALACNMSDMGSIDFSIIETNVTHYITFKPRNCNSPSCVDPPLLATLGPEALMVEFPRSYLDPALLFFVGISYIGMLLIREV